MDDSLSATLRSRPHHRGRGHVSRGEQNAHEASIAGTEVAMAYIDHFFHVLLAGRQARTLHLAQGQPPKIRRHGEILPIREEALTDEEMSFMLSEICSAARWQRFEETGDLDFAYEMDEDTRFRCNYLKQTQRLRRGLPNHPHEDHDARRARRSGGHQEIRPHARRPRAGHRPHRLRQVHDARGADGLHQHQLLPPHHHRSRSRSNSFTATNGASSPSARCPSTPSAFPPA